MKVARNNAQVRQLMTAPGIGPVTALCFVATIDDPRRFKRSRSVGTYVALTTRRYASGEIDWTGRISKCGDKMLRSYLFEAADVLFTRVAKISTQSLGHSACEAKRAAQSQGCGCAKARCHSASDVDRRYRIYVVVKGDRQPNSIANYRIPADNWRDPRSLPGRLALVGSPLALRCSKEQARFTH
jgi:hypothetical protein